MAESTMSPTAEAAAPAPAPAPGPIPLRLTVASNGDPAGTRLVDEQGNAVTFTGCHGRLDLRAEAGKGVAQLVLVFPDIPVQLEGAPPPFILLGVVLGGDKPGPLPAELTVGAGLPLAAGPLPGPPPGPPPGAPARQAHYLHPSTGAAMRHNDGLNSAQPGSPGRI